MKKPLSIEERVYLEISFFHLDTMAVLTRKQSHAEVRVLLLFLLFNSVAKK